MRFIILGLGKHIQEFVHDGRVLDLLIVRRERLLMFQVVGRSVCLGNQTKGVYDEKVAESRNSFVFDGVLVCMCHVAMWRRYGY